MNTKTSGRYSSEYMYKMIIANEWMNEIDFRNVSSKSVKFSQTLLNKYTQNEEKWWQLTFYLKCVNKHKKELNRKRKIERNQ